MVWEILRCRCWEHHRALMLREAAETGVLLHFAAELAWKHRAVATHGQSLAKAGPPLVRYLELMKETPQQVDERTRDIFLECFKTHCIHLEDAAVPFLPKHHMMCHMTLDMCAKGNTRYYSTFLDETLHGMMATVASKAHKLRWEERVYMRLDLQARLRPKGHWAGRQILV